MTDQPDIAPLADGTQRAVLVEHRPSGLIKIKKATRIRKPPSQAQDQRKSRKTKLK